MGGEADANEPTTAEKLASLAAAEEENKVDEQPSSPVPVKLPSADSVHVRLKQALHTDDHSVLLQCVYTTDEKIIQSRISTLESALQIPDNEAEDERAGPTIIYEDSDSDEEDDDEDTMDTEDEEDELGDFIDSPQDSDGSEVISD